jgi:hypothetical protein
MTINVSVIDSVPSYKNYCDIKLLLMVRVNDHLHCVWLEFSAIGRKGKSTSVL